MADKEKIFVEYCCRVCGSDAISITLSTADDRSEYHCNNCYHEESRLPATRQTFESFLRTHIKELKRRKVRVLPTAHLDAFQIGNKTVLVQWDAKRKDWDVWLPVNRDDVEKDIVTFLNAKKPQPQPKQLFND